MAAPLSFARKAGALAWLIGPTLVLALLVGCTHTQKSSPAKSATAQTTAQPAAVKPAAKPATAAPAADKTGVTAVKADKPAQTPPADKPAAAPPAPAATEKPKAAPAKEELPARKTTEAVPAEATQQPNWPIPTDRPMTEQERDALAAMIRAAAEEGQRRQAAEPPKPKPSAKPTTTQPAEGTEPGTAKKEGCGAGGASTIDLTPPPPDKPQPKFECKQKKVVAEEVWQGKAAEFNFTLTNAGEGPLAIRIKKP